MVAVKATWPLPIDHHSMQLSVMEEVNLRANQDERWSYIAAIPNGGKRNKGTAGQLYAEGVRAGVPDLFWFLAMRGFHGMAVELKVTPDRPSPAQKRWLYHLIEGGYCSLVIYNDPSLVIAAFEWYIANGAPPFDCPLHEHLLRASGLRALIQETL